MTTLKDLKSKNDKRKNCQRIKNGEHFIQKLNKIEKIPEDMSHVIYVSH